MDITNTKPDKTVGTGSKMRWWLRVAQFAGNRRAFLERTLEMRKTHRYTKTWRRVCGQRSAQHPDPDNPSTRSR
jgi:hypothetical protein